MKELFTYRLNRWAAYFALWSFLLGTFLFFLITAIETSVVTGLGIALLVIYGILAPLTLFVLVVNALINYKDLRQHVVAFFMVLVSISISILYYIIVTDF